MITFLIIWYIIISLITALLEVHSSIGLNSNTPGKFKSFLISFILIIIITPILSVLIDTNIVLRELINK